ncbi:MAG: alpha/beta hydrolase [Bauldia sp.]|nr:alpha/beta hydrolase [Bauldia sp.]
MRRALLILTLVLVSVLAASWLMFSREQSAAEARLTGRSELVTTAFGTVEYAEAGNGPPVLMIHGSGGGFDQGLDFAAPLVEAGFRIIAPSRFGYLRSSFPDEPSVELQADALDALLAQLGEERVVIYGGSAGALSAIQLAVRHPGRCRGLVLLVPATYAPDRAPNEAAAPSGVMQFVIENVLPNDFVFWAATRLVPGTMTRLLLATDPALVRAADPAEQERAARILRHIFPVSRRAEGLFFDSATAGAPERYPLDRIACPVLTISAEDDLFGTAQAARFIAAEAPDARLVMYPEGGHILIGHDAEANREIVGFINALPDAVAELRIAP